MAVAQLSAVDITSARTGVWKSCSQALLFVQVLEARIDHSRVVSILRKADHLPLVKDYLIAVQKGNLAAVNDAVNELLIEEEDFKVMTSLVCNGCDVLKFCRSCNFGRIALFKGPFRAVHKSDASFCNMFLTAETSLQGLRDSITTYDNFDQLSLASQLEKHELMEFRRISAFIYKKALRWRKAVALAKQDKLYKVTAVLYVASAL